MKTEWWYDDATLHYSHDSQLALARLIVRDDGMAHILTAGAEQFEFEKEDDAISWFLSEEYRRLEDLSADRKEEGLPEDPRIKPPTASTDEELPRSMVISLGPASPPIPSIDPGEQWANAPK